MAHHENNYAFIDSQNLNKGVTSLGWKLDYQRFRVYLKHKYHVSHALLFIGYIPTNASLYKALQEYGYTLIFKPVLEREGKTKGNVDAELVLHAMIEYPHYDSAVLVSSDGDFACLTDYLRTNNKLKKVISPQYKTCSVLLRKAARDNIVFIDNLEKKLSYKGKNTA